MTMHVPLVPFLALSSPFLAFALESRAGQATDAAAQAGIEGANDGAMDDSVTAPGAAKGPARLGDALFAIPTRNARCQPVGDLDGDGLTELLVEANGRFVLHAGGSGRPLDELGVITYTVRRGGLPWAVGPDMNRDGLRDLGVLTSVGGVPHVAVVSTTDGSVLTLSEPIEGTPSAVAWVGDVNSDGFDDLAVADGAGPTVVLHSGTSLAPLWSLPAFSVAPYPTVRLQNAGDRNGDGLDDLLLDADRFGRAEGVMVSGSSGRVFPDRLAGAGSGSGPLVTMGDLDGDGLGDFVRSPQPDSGIFTGNFRLIRSNGDGWLHAFPDPMSEFAVLRALPDLDGDGIREIGVGDANFNLAAPGSGRGFEVEDLGALDLETVYQLMSAPFRMGAESGCAWALSGRTGKILMGVYGEPGTALGVGLDLFPAGDQNGDGVPDVAVLSSKGLHVFAAPTPAGAERNVSAPATTVAELGWMAGTWRSEADGRVSEEVWLDPKGGRMLGVSRTFGVEDDGSQGPTGSFEFLRIEDSGGVPTLFAQPGGEPAVGFRLTGGGATEALFTNPEHDFPTRIRYWREGDVLFAEVGTEAEPARIALRWDRD